MYKSLEFTRMPASVSVKKTQAAPESLASNIVTQINNFIDSFDQDKDYPPAIVALKYGPKIKKKKVHEAIIEDFVPDKMRRTRLHLAVLTNDRRWLRLVCSEALDKELLDVDIYGKTPLHYAAHTELLNELLNRRNNVASFLQIPDAEGNTALHIMALANRFDKSVLAQLRPSELKFLLHIENIQNQNVLDIIEDNNDRRLLAYLRSRYEK